MKNTLRFTAALLSVICLAVSLVPVTARAGSSKTTVDNCSFEEKLDNTVWNNPNGDVIIQDGKLVFPAESTADTRLITKTAVSKSDVISEMLYSSYSLKAVDIPEGKSFIIAIGLRSIESFSGEKGNIELRFSNDGGLQVGLYAYETADKAVTLAQPQQVGSGITAEWTLTADQHLTVKVNGTVLFDDTLPVTGEGRVGFLQTGGCHVEVSEVKIETFGYDRPENANVSERFDNGTMDTARLGSAMIKDYGYYPCRISVEDYKDNDVMMFRNSGLGYIGTKYPYSNFELTFDVPYLQREEVYAEDFTLLTPKSSWFGISFGDEYMDATWYDYDYKSPYMVYFTEYSQVVDLKQDHKILAELADSDHAFFAEGEERGFSVRFAVIDARVEIGIKWENEESFTKVCEYGIENGQTPTGYIHIWGSEPNNFAIDNIVITNKDVDPQLVEPDYCAGSVEVPQEHAFEKAEMIYKDTPVAEEPEGGFNWYVLIPCAGGIAALLVAVSCLIAGKRKRKAVA